MPILEGSNQIWTPRYLISNLSPTLRTSKSSSRFVDWISRVLVARAGPFLA